MSGCGPVHAGVGPIEEFGCATWCGFNRAKVWHRATTPTAMTHMAIQERLGGERHTACCISPTSNHWGEATAPRLSTHGARVMLGARRADRIQSLAEE